MILLNSPGTLRNAPLTFVCLHIIYKVFFLSLKNLALITLAGLQLTGREHRVLELDYTALACRIKEALA